jgi:Ca2+/Na+ antiporter
LDALAAFFNLPHDVASATVLAFGLALPEITLNVRLLCLPG